MNKPTHLRVEHLDEPLGIDVRAPRLSWWLPEGAEEQIAYELRVDGANSGRVGSSDSVLVPYWGPVLRSGQQVMWQVRVWTNAGESQWSEPAAWEMGLLDRADWVAQWIEPTEADSIRKQSPRPAYSLRGSFIIEETPVRARLYVTSHGIYEFFINGRRTGNMELTPGFTSYWSNLQVQTFDVTDFIQLGANVLGGVVSDGWFRGQTSGLRNSSVYGEAVALLAQLNVHGADGSLTCVGTGPDWLSATGVILSADLIQGQSTDLRREDLDWCTTKASTDGWAPVVVRDYDLNRLRASPSPPVRRIEELRPLGVARPCPGRQVFDIGQNMNGWVRLTGLGAAGDTYRLTHGEALDTRGDVTLTNVTLNAEAAAAIVDPEWDLSNLRLPLQVDHVISAGRPGDSFEPRHTIHGFRYVQIDGPTDLSANDVTGVVVHSDLRRTGWFECSDDRINRLHEAAVWSFRGNACDIPTDCPTRERVGWTGDWQAFVATAAFLYDVAGFATKWLHDLKADQDWDGAVPAWIPNTLKFKGGRSPVPAGSAGYADAAVIVPWEIYCAYGDKRVLEEQWSSMVGWVEHAARAAREHRHPKRISDRPIPAAHEQFIWDTGFHFGEWLEPNAPPNQHDTAGGVTDLFTLLRTADQGLFATAYLCYSSRLLSWAARVLGRDVEAVRYQELSEATKMAWQTEYISPHGELAIDTQSTCVRALAFDLVPEELRPRVARRLVEVIRAAGTHLSTGFYATPHLLPVLADMGYADVAYELLFQDTEPSWLNMLEKGATTIWEHWSGVDDRGIPRLSLNHHSKGAVASFLHRYVAGIRSISDEPAYKKFRIEPVPGGGLTFAQAVLDCPYGRIDSSWQLDGEQFRLQVTIPPGTRAEVCMPDGRRFDVRPGFATFLSSSGA